MIKRPEIEEFIKIFPVFLIQIWKKKGLKSLDKFSLFDSNSHGINIHIIDDDLRDRSDFPTTYKQLKVISCLSAPQVDITWIC